MATEITFDEVGRLLLIAAMYADKIVAQADTDDSLKAVALKAKSLVTVTPLPDDNAYYKTKTYTLAVPRRRTTWLEIG